MKTVEEFVERYGNLNADVCAAVWEQVQQYGDRSQYELGGLLASPSKDGWECRESFARAVSAGAMASSEVSLPQGLDEVVTALAAIPASAPVASPTSGTDDVVEMGLRGRLWNVSSALQESARYGDLAIVAEGGSSHDFARVAEEVVRVELAMFSQRVMLWPKFEEVCERPAGAIDLDKPNWRSELEDSIMFGEPPVVCFDGDLPRESIHYLVDHLTLDGDLRAMVQCSQVRGVVLNDDFGGANCANNITLAMAASGNGRSAVKAMRDFAQACERTMAGRASRRAMFADWGSCAASRGLLSRRLGLKESGAGVKEANQRCKGENVKKAADPDARMIRETMRTAGKSSQLGMG